MMSNPNTLHPNLMKIDTGTGMKNGAIVVICLTLITGNSRCLLWNRRCRLVLSYYAINARSSTTLTISY